jgi:hypothetical protein
MNASMSPSTAWPVGNAYAVWTGIGAIGAAVLGIALFGEPATLARIGCIALIVGRHCWPQVEGCALTGSCASSSSLKVGEV